MNWCKVAYRNFSEFKTQTHYQHQFFNSFSRLQGMTGGPPGGWAYLCSSRIFRWHFILFVNLIFGFYCFHWIQIYALMSFVMMPLHQIQIPIQNSWTNIFIRFVLNDSPNCQNEFIFSIFEIRIFASISRTVAIFAIHHLLWLIRIWWALKRKKNHVKSFRFSVFILYLMFQFGQMKAKILNLLYIWINRITSFYATVFV